MDYRTALALALFSATVSAQDVQRTLTAVEQHYNAPRTLQLRFQQTFRAAARPARTENGILYLRKPGKMRWEYRYPEGKLFVADGQWVYLYDPALKVAEKSKLKGSDDLRAPLAFLMGRLDFRRDFQNFNAQLDGDQMHIKAVPRSAQSPYRTVEFWVSPQNRLTRVTVAGQDASLMTFTFDAEVLNPPVADRQFTFEPPPGVPLVNVDGEK
jgi:outer membrane lipoprotein carrier protein